MYGSHPRDWAKVDLEFFNARKSTPNDKHSLAADGTGITDEVIQRDYNFRSGTVLDEAASARLTLRSRTRLVGKIRLHEYTECWVINQVHRRHKIVWIIDSYVAKSKIICPSGNESRYVGARWQPQHRCTVNVLSPGDAFKFCKESKTIRLNEGERFLSPSKAQRNES